MFIEYNVLLTTDRIKHTIKQIISNCTDEQGVPA